MGVANATVAALRELGHDVVHAREAGYQTLLDAEILAHARSQTRIVLTFDLDFGDLLARMVQELDRRPKRRDFAAILTASEAVTSSRISLRWRDADATAIEARAQAIPPINRDL